MVAPALPAKWANSPQPFSDHCRRASAVSRIGPHGPVARRPSLRGRSKGYGIFFHLGARRQRLASGPPPIGLAGRWRSAPPLPAVFLPECRGLIVAGVDPISMLLARLAIAIVLIILTLALTERSHFALTGAASGGCWSSGCWVASVFAVFQFVGLCRCLDVSHDRNERSPSSCPCC